ncbi:MAG: sigma-54-dependent Fis family transcriptional regulator [Gammaproteobacteria bacterium]|nr:sigma-54-dependent Fis family transcriptional regulator [Gammaproteobacteria bacterium]
MSSVLIVDDEPGICHLLQRDLRKYFGLIEVAGDVEMAKTLCQRCFFDLIIADSCLLGQVGVEWVTELREQGGATGVIFMTADADLETAIVALRAGADDFITKPFGMEQMVAAVQRHQQRQHTKRQISVLRREVEQGADNLGLVGDCTQIVQLRQLIKRIAPMPSTVLIEGESGTGKELAARAIHEWSGCTGSFVAVNCSAMSAELLESELFGHVKGAFTGAMQTRMGLFTHANEGTLFLDEIGEMPLSLQAHLLRVLEERSVRPVGSNQELPVKVRIIAATNRDLGEDMRSGEFREDLFYRLNVLSITMPSLRERREDIPLLARHFINILSSELGLEVPKLCEREITRLRLYSWPGNVRELKNVIERCLLLNREPSGCVAALVGDSSSDQVSEEGDGYALDTVVKRHILKVLEQEGGNKSAAARLLGVSRKTLERKVQAWGTG